MKTLPIGYRLSAFFGSRIDTTLSVQTAARHAHRMIELARKLDRLNAAHHNGQNVFWEIAAIRPMINDIAYAYLLRGEGERVVFGTDPRGPAVRIFTDKLGVDCIGGGTAIQ